MPFELRIESVSYQGEEAWITGALTRGAYSGPEAISFFGTDGSEHQSIPVSHGIDNPTSWPVRAGDGATLRLTIPWKGGIEIDESRGVVGHGVVMRASTNLDIDAELEDRRFWATELAFYVQSSLADPDVDAHEHLFGVSTDELNAYYERTFTARYHAGAWPRIRVKLPGTARYVEYESAAGIEYQTRYWIGDADTGEHVLLGYQSGHFSTPALRPEEIFRLADQWVDTPMSHFAALLSTVTYVPERSAELERFVRNVTTDLPGAQHVDELREAIQEMMVGSDVIWQRDAKRGWTNNWPYSQRNPESGMSILSADDYAFIERFFEPLVSRA